MKLTFHLFRGTVLMALKQQTPFTLLPDQGYSLNTNSQEKSGRLVKNYSRSVKLSGNVNETTLYRSVLGPLGLGSNLLNSVSLENDAWIHKKFMPNNAWVPRYVSTTSRYW